VKLAHHHGHCGANHQVGGHPLISGFTRTCVKDLDHLTYLLRSVCKFGFPFLSGYTVTYAAKEAPQIEPVLMSAFPWVHARPSIADQLIVEFVKNRTGHSAPTSAGKSFFFPGVGYHAALIDKLDADLFIGSDDTREWEYIMYYDSDNVLTRPLRPSDGFAIALKPDGQTRYQLRLVASAWASAQAVPRATDVLSRRGWQMHEDAWRSHTAQMLNLTLAEVRYSTMTQGGGLMYPAWMHTQLRSHLLRTLGKSLHEYAAALLEDRRKHEHMAADYELLGGYLKYVASDGGGVLWEEEDGSAAHPWRDEAALPFPVLQENSWLKQGLSLERRLDYECILGSSAREAEEYDQHKSLLARKLAHRATGWCAGLQGMRSVARSVAEART